MWTADTQSRIGSTRLLLLLVALWVGAVTGCQSSKQSGPTATESNLTAGMAKRTIVKGATTQAQVLEVFGPPDLVTHKDDMQVWTYDKIRQEVETTSGYLTVIVAGTATERSSRSSTSTMLILYFDAKDIVQDYRLSVVKF